MVDKALEIEKNEFWNVISTQNGKTFKQQLQYDIGSIINLYSFEENSEETRARIRSDIRWFLDGHVLSGTIFQYQVICSTSNNTLDHELFGELVCDVYYWRDPERTKQIHIGFQVHLDE